MHKFSQHLWRKLTNLRLQIQISPVSALVLKNIRDGLLPATGANLPGISAYLDFAFIPYAFSFHQPHGNFPPIAFQYVSAPIADDKTQNAVNQRVEESPLLDNLPHTLARHPFRQASLFCLYKVKYATAPATDVESMAMYAKKINTTAKIII